MTRYRRLTLLIAPLAIAAGFGLSAAPTFADEPCPNEASRAAQGSTNLPDCRAYEMVSPPSKNGGDIMGDSAHTRAAASGDAVAFTSLTGFGDVLGTGIAADYVSRRDGVPGTNGWHTHAITPPQLPVSSCCVAFSLDAAYQGEFSADLSEGVTLASSPVTSGAPNVEHVDNLYMRDDLLSPGAGSYHLLTDSITELANSNGGYRPAFNGASADFGHVIFTSTKDLTADASGGEAKLYEWDHGTTRLAGILPDGSPAASSLAGRDTGGVSAPFYTPHTISDDGSRIFFTDPSTGTGNGDGDIYMRVDHATTVQINASEKTVPDPPARATFQTASADGTKVFFTTEGSLVDGGGAGLYRYDVSAPAGHHLTYIGGGDVLGASDSGDTVYFLSPVQLVPGQPDLGGNNGIFRWHDGTTSFVGELARIEDRRLNIFDNWILEPKSSRVSPDGKHLLFSSHSSEGLPGGYDHGSCFIGSNEPACAELYVYSADTGLVVCASCKPNGAAATADARDIFKVGPGGTSTTSHLNHPLSADGRYVFFSTGDALVPQDKNGNVLDVYEFDTTTDQVHLLSSGRGDANSYFMDASSSGRDVFFLTRDRLAGWDIDSNFDLYDARVNGGFPEPVVPKTCTGDSCQGLISSPPAIGAPASNTFFGGSDNVVPSVSKVVAKPLTKAQKLSKALKKCKTKRKRVQRKKCEALAHKSFGRGK